MPQIIPVIFSALGTAGVLAPTTAAVLTIASSVALGVYERDRAKAKARDAYNKSLQDRIATIRSAVAPRRYVLGTIRTSATVLFASAAEIEGEQGPT